MDLVVINNMKVEASKQLTKPVNFFGHIYKGKKLNKYTDCDSNSNQVWLKLFMTLFFPQVTNTSLEKASS